MQTTVTDTQHKPPGARTQFFCTTSDRQALTNSYLKAACAAHGVDYVPPEAATFDYLKFAGEGR